MFGLTKREQRWAAEQKAAEVLIPAIVQLTKAKIAMDTNEHIFALEAELAKVKADFERQVDLSIEWMKAYEKVKAERDAALADWGRVLMFARFIDKKLDSEQCSKSSVSGITHDAGERAQWIANLASKYAAPPYLIDAARKEGL